MHKYFKKSYFKVCLPKIKTPPSPQSVSSTLLFFHTLHFPYTAFSILRIFHPTFGQNSQVGGQIIQFCHPFNIIPKVTFPLCPILNQLCDEKLQLPMEKSRPVLLISGDRFLNALCLKELRDDVPNEERRDTKYIDAGTGENLC